MLIDDVDTAPDANVTMTLSVDKGLLILSGYEQPAASSPTVLKIAVAESNGDVRTFLENSLLALGHLVDTFTTGRPTPPYTLSLSIPSLPPSLLLGVAPGQVLTY